MPGCGCARLGGPVKRHFAASSRSGPVKRHSRWPGKEALESYQSRADEEGSSFVDSRRLKRQDAIDPVGRCSPGLPSRRQKSFSIVKQIGVSRKWPGEWGWRVNRAES